jgi:hypothetical protein
MVVFNAVLNQILPPRLPHHAMLLPPRLPHHAMHRPRPPAVPPCRRAVLLI